MVTEAHDHPGLYVPSRVAAQMQTEMEKQQNIGALPPALGGDSSVLISGARAPDLGAIDVLRLYGKSPWLRAVVNKVGKAVGTAQWTLHVVPLGRRNGIDTDAPRAYYGKVRKLQRNWDVRMRRRTMRMLKAEQELEEIVDHPLLALLQNMNPVLLAATAFQLTQMYMDLVGEWFWMLERNPFTVPKAIWPIPPTWVVDLPSNKRPSFKLRISGKDIEVPATEMIMARDPNPMNPYQRGIGIAKTLGDELATDEYAANHTKNFFFNRARPDIIISGKRLDRVSTHRLEERWLEEHQGFWRVFKPIFLSGEVDIKELTQGMKDLGVQELRERIRDTVISIYGAPPEKLAVLSSSNRATITAANQFWNQDVILPRLEMLRMIMQEALVPEFDDRLILDFESPAADDPEHRLAVMEASPNWFTANEWRAEADFDADDRFGNMRGVPTGVIEIDAGDDDDGLDGPTGDPPPAPDDGPEPMQPPVGSTSLRAHKATQRDIAQIAAAARVEEVEGVLPSVAEEEITSFANRRLSEIGVDIDFNASDPRVVNHLRELGGDRIRNINETTRTRIRRTLVRGVEQGDDIGRLTRRLRAVFSEATGPRALMIARTESVRAMNVGQLAATIQAGFEGKRWLSTRDQRVRDSHIALDGQERAVNEDFESPVTGARGPHPGNLGVPEEDVNCRCTVISIPRMQRDAGDDSGHPFDTEEKLESYWKTNERARQPFERKMRTEMTRAFRRQQRAVQAKLEELLQR